MVSLQASARSPTGGSAGASLSAGGSSLGGGGGGGGAASQAGGSPGRADAITAGAAGAAAPAAAMASPHAPPKKKRQKTKYNPALKYSHALEEPDEDGRSICQFCLCFGREASEVPAAPATPGKPAKKKRKPSAKPLYFDDFSRCRIEEHYKLTHKTKFAEYREIVARDGPSNQLLATFFGAAGFGDFGFVMPASAAAAAAVVAGVGSGNGAGGEGQVVVVGGAVPTAMPLQAAGAGGVLEQRQAAAEQSMLARLKSAGVSADSVKEMSRNDLACTLAAFIIGYREEEVAHFEELQVKLATLFREKYIFGGDVLVGEHAMSAADFINMVSYGLTRSYGLETQLRRFTCKLGMGTGDGGGSNPATG